VFGLVVVSIHVQTLSKESNGFMNLNPD
jgi:hypothetical protein